MGMGAYEELENLEDYFIYIGAIFVKGLSAENSSTG